MEANGKGGLIRRFFKKLNPYHHRAYVREVMALRSKKGPYRFLVRNWKGVTDIDLAAGVLKTEFFRHELEPVSLPIEAVKSILVLAPHQDDEAIGCGGALLLAAKSGVSLNVVYVTDGSQSKSKRKKGVTDEIRRREARQVCSELGAGIHELNISNLDPRPTVADIDQLSALIHELKPEVVMVPWLLDSPPKHRMVNHMLWLANRRRPLPECEVWGYQVHNTPFANGYVDITGVAEEKRGLLQHYHSQNDYCRYDHLAMGLAAWNAHLLGSTPDPRYVEVFFALPAFEFFGLVEMFYFADLQMTYRGDSNVIAGLAALHEAVIQAPVKRRFLKLGRAKRNALQRSLGASILLAQYLMDSVF